MHACSGRTGAASSGGWAGQKEARMHLTVAEEQHGRQGGNAKSFCQVRLICNINCGVDDLLGLCELGRPKLFPRLAQVL